MGFVTSGLITKVLATTGITAGIVASTVAFGGQGGLDSMKARMDQASTKIHELVGQTQSWESYTAGLQGKFTSTVNNANSQIGSLKAKNTELQNTIKSLDSKLKAANTRISVLESEKAKLIIDREALRVALNIKTAQYNAEVAAHKNTKSTLEAEIASLKSQIAGLNSQISVLNTQITDLNKAKSDLESQITALNTEKKGLEDQILALENEANGKLDDLHNQAQTEITRLEGEVDKANKDGQANINKLEDEVNKANNAVQDAASYVNGVDVSGNGAKDVSSVSGYTPPTLDTAAAPNLLSGTEGTDEAPAASEPLAE